MTTRIRDRPPPLSERSPGSGRRRDVGCAAAAVVLVAVAAVAGRVIDRHGGVLYVGWPPLYADWLPHVGPGTPAALAVAVLVVGYGPVVARRLPWRALPWCAWGAAMAWTWSLALVDGWHRGAAGRLATEHEYLRAVDRFGDVGAALRGFTGHILLTQPDHWPAHVSGHPPAAVLTFVGLDRLGLGGGGWAAAWCVTAGTSAVAAVLVALRALGAERSARRAAPFLVLTPAAVWLGVSADGYFAGVAAWGLALLALAATRGGWASRAWSLGAGLLFGLAVYLSYGLALVGLCALAVLAAARTARPLPWVLLGAAAVAAGFTAAGFDWWQGYHLLVRRYYQGVAADRPYGYWVWGDPATAVCAAGVACVAGGWRVAASAPGAARRTRSGPASGEDSVVAVVLGVLCAIAVADLSGMSKAETERIWLPFLVWLPASAALLPGRDHRRWLAAQAAAALLINHLLLTGW